MTTKKSKWDDTRKRCSVMSTTTVESWSTEMNSTTPSVSQSGGVANAKSTITASTASSSVPPTPSTMMSGCPSPSIAVPHRLVSTKGTYIGVKKCCECRKFLIYYSLKKEEIFVCEVCGVRVHKGCYERVRPNCAVTSQFVGGLVQSAIMRSNKKKWDPIPSCSSTPQSPVTFSQTNISSYEEVTESVVVEDDEKEKQEKLSTWEDILIRPKDISVRGKIGEGRFGVVHFGSYHGDAAIKFVNMNHVEESRRVEAFRHEVVTAYKNSRHNHIALFLGYFVDPLTNSYGIVTNFYHGKTLFHRIHESNEDVDVPWALAVSLQISHAMAYLHKRKIIHRDLRSKNILLDKSNNVFVADFGLLKLERLVIPKRTYTMMVPNHWLDYVAPEIAVNLFTTNDEIVQTELGFSCESDMFAFGTIFYELLMRKMPSGNSPWEVKMYEKVIGTKAALNRLDTQTKKVDTKYSQYFQLLMKCWNESAQLRPTFTTVNKSLTSLIRRKDSFTRRSTHCLEAYF